MLYKETESKNKYLELYHSFCKENLGAKYPQWIVACRILGLSPAAFAKLLVEEFNATVTWNPETCYLGKSWDNQADMRKWKNFINKKAREKNFQI